MQIQDSIFEIFYLQLILGNKSCIIQITSLAFYLKVVLYGYNLVTTNIIVHEIVRVKC
jgi:hypothetical protein